jgi:hypothetical protein
MKMFKIYKYTCYGDSSTNISFSTTNKDFKEEMRDNRKQGFDTSDDTIETIKFKDTDELCEQIGYQY